MAGVLEGVEVLDLSWGIPGPVTGMLLADHGARVTKIEPPGGDPGGVALEDDVGGAREREQPVAVVGALQVEERAPLPPVPDP